MVYLRLLFAEKSYLLSLKNNIPYWENFSGIVNYSIKIKFVELFCLFDTVHFHQVTQVTKALVVLCLGDGVSLTKRVECILLLPK